jgi:hypothetical protein
MIFILTVTQKTKKKNIHLKIYITNEIPFSLNAKKNSNTDKFYVWKRQRNPPIYISRGKHNAGDGNSVLWHHIWDFSFYRCFFLSFKPNNDTCFVIQTATKNKKEMYIYTQQIHLVDMYID